MPSSVPRPPRRPPRRRARSGSGKRRAGLGVLVLALVEQHERDVGVLGHHEQLTLERDLSPRRVQELGQRVRRGGKGLERGESRRTSGTHLFLPLGGPQRAVQRLHCIARERGSDPTGHAEPQNRREPVRAGQGEEEDDARVCCVCSKISPYGASILPLAGLRLPCVLMATWKREKRAWRSGERWGREESEVSWALAKGRRSSTRTMRTPRSCALCTAGEGESAGGGESAKAMRRRGGRERAQDSQRTALHAPTESRTHL